MSSQLVKRPVIEAEERPKVGRRIESYDQVHTARGEPLHGRRVQSLDCLRAVACLAVIYGHGPAKHLRNIWTIGEYGVALFCVLSGFLITRLILEEERVHKTLDVIGFLQRRALRIVPAYYATIFSVSTIVLYRTCSETSSRRDGSAMERTS